MNFHSQHTWRTTTLMKNQKIVNTSMLFLPPSKYSLTTTAIRELPALTCVDGILRPVSLCVWFLSLNIMFVKCVHTAVFSCGPLSLLDSIPLISQTTIYLYMTSYGYHINLCLYHICMICSWWTFYFYFNHKQHCYNHPCTWVSVHITMYLWGIHLRGTTGHGAGVCSTSVDSVK